jgi:preprotein translocase subunit SecE
MNKITKFIADTVEEVKNQITWPTYDELQKNSFLVLVASLLFALVIGLVDFGFKAMMEVLYNSN